MIASKGLLKSTVDTAMIVLSTQRVPFGNGMIATRSNQSGAAVMLSSFCQIHEVIVKLGISALALLSALAFIVSVLSAQCGIGGSSLCRFLGMLAILLGVAFTPTLIVAALIFALLLDKCRIVSAALLDIAGAVVFPPFAVAILAARLQPIAGVFLSVEFCEGLRQLTDAAHFRGIMRVHRNLSFRCHATGVTSTAWLYVP